MRNTLETRLGLFVALVLIAAVIIIETIGGAERFRRGYRMDALFNNVQELKVGDRVKMAGVEIGRVESISLTNNKVLVEMKIRRDAGVRTDSIATVKFTGLLGQNYVSIDFGSGNTLAGQGTLLETAEQPDLSAMMKKLDDVASGIQNVTKSFTGDTLDNLLGPLTDFMKTNQVPLTATISNIQSITAQISRGQGTVGKLIYDDTLYKTALTSADAIKGVAADLSLTVADARKIIDQANSGRGTVGKLLTDDTLFQEATASMTNLREILQKINQGQGSVGKLINDQEFYKNAKMTLQKLDQATEGLEDQGPLSVLGSAVSKLF
jgi:phospholipid/cholesterol/gamma-HCH transport system substrate-binding protein